MNMMRSAGALGFLVSGLLAGCVGSPVGAGDEPGVATAVEALSSTSYSGRASVLRAQVLKIGTNIADTGPLPSAGGTSNVSVLTTNVAGLLRADALDSYVTGQNNHTIAQTTVANVKLGVSVANITVGATVVASHAQAACTGNVPSLSGGSVITALTINGSSIVVTGAPNQTVNLLLGKVIINERATTQSGAAGAIHVAAVRVVVAGLVDVVLAAADAGITCAPPPPPPEPTCHDQQQNGTETDVDCGGPSCAPCGDGQGCMGPSDCESQVCENGTCSEVPACTPHDYVTGQGYITSTPAPSTRNGYFSFYAEAPNGVPTGNAVYDDDGSSEHVKSIDVTAYTITGPTSRRIQGHCTVRNKVGTYTYTVDVTDNGASGDLFTIAVSDGYQATGVVASGTEDLFVKTCP